MSVECGHPGNPDVLVSTGPIIKVKVGFDRAYRGRGLPQVVDRVLPALVDTGATNCFIDGDVAIAHHPPVVDQDAATGIFGPETVNMYLGQLVIPELDGYTVYGRFAGVDLSGLGVAALVGRWPVLARCVMSYDGRSGSVVLERRGSSQQLRCQTGPEIQTEPVPVCAAAVIPLATMLVFAAYHRT